MDLSRTLRVAMGIGDGQVSVDRVVLCAGGGTQWMDDDTVVYQRADTHGLSEAAPDGSGELLIDAGGANHVVAGGGVTAWHRASDVRKGDVTYPRGYHDDFGAHEPTWYPLAVDDESGLVAVLTDYQGGRGLAVWNAATKVLTPLYAGALDRADGCFRRGVLVVQSGGAWRSYARRPDGVWDERVSRAFGLSGTQHDGVWGVAWSEAHHALVAHQRGEPVAVVVSRSGRDFNARLRAEGSKLTIVSSAGAGELPTELQRYEIDVTTATDRIDLSAVPVPRINKPAVLAWFGFGPSTAPANATLPVVNGAWLELSAGARYVSGEPDGDIDSLEANARRAREGYAGPVIGYWTRRAQAGRVPDVDIVAVEAYRLTTETLEQFEARVRAAVRRCRCAMLVAQCYTSNATHTTDLVSLVPVYARIVRDEPNVLGILAFSDGQRATGYRDHPEVHAAWAALFASITGVPDLSVTRAHIPVGTVTITAFSPTSGASPLRVRAVAAITGDVASLRWRYRMLPSDTWSTDAVNPATDLDHTFTFTAIGAYDLGVDALDHDGRALDATGAVRRVSVTSPATVLGRFALMPSERLVRGQSLALTRHRLHLGLDGRLALTRTDGTVLWSPSAPGDTLVMQGDGNLVLYRDDVAVWDSGTAGNPNALAILQHDGNVVVYDDRMAALWASETVDPVVAPTPGDARRPTRADVLDYRGLLCNLRDAVGRVVWTPALPGASIETRLEWLHALAAAGACHVPIGPFSPGDAYPGVAWGNPNWESDPAAIRALVVDILSIPTVRGHGLIPVIFADSGGRDPKPRLRRVFPTLIEALSGLWDSVLVAPCGWEPVVGDWTSAEVSWALTTWQSLSGGQSLVAYHGSPERLVGSSNPVEADDPWQGGESAFYTAHGGQHIDIALYQTPHGPDLYRPCVCPRKREKFGHDDGCWRNRWEDYAARIGAGHNGWRVLPIVLWETIAYEFFRGQVSASEAARIAREAQDDADKWGVRIGFGNGWPA